MMMMVVHVECGVNMRSLPPSCHRVINNHLDRLVRARPGMGMASEYHRHPVVVLVAAHKRFVVTSRCNSQRQLDLVMESSANFLCTAQANKPRPSRHDRCLLAIVTDVVVIVFHSLNVWNLGVLGLVTCQCCTGFREFSLDAYYLDTVEVGTWGIRGWRT
jgi:hypothetical protein